MKCSTYGAMDINSSQREGKMQLELKEDEAEFVAAELHHRYLGMDEDKKRKALRIANKIAEQLVRQRQEKEERGRKWY